MVLVVVSQWWCGIDGVGCIGAGVVLVVLGYGNDLILMEV